jgi:hypothetical protein
MRAHLNSMLLPLFMYRKPNPQTAAARLQILKEELWARGFNRGASRGWLARNNRKLSRIAART